MPRPLDLLPIFHNLVLLVNKNYYLLYTYLNYIYIFTFLYYYINLIQFNIIIFIVYGKNLLHWALELGASGIKIAAAAQAVSFKNTSAASKTISSNIVNLVVI